MKKLNLKLTRTLIAFFILMFSYGIASAQNVANQSSLNVDGINIIKTSTANFNIYSGVDFQYIINYSLPGNLSDVTLRDVIPQSLELFNFTNNVVSGNSPTSISNGSSLNFELNWVNTGNGVVGTLVFHVRFPNGITCNDTKAENKVCIKYKINNITKDYCENNTNPPSAIMSPIVDKAIAKNPWQLAKSILGNPSVSNAAPCRRIFPNANGSYTVPYHLKLVRSNATGLLGLLNLSNGVITDIIQTTSNGKVGTIDGINTPPTGFTVTGVNSSTLTVTCPSLLNAATYTNTQFVNFTVTYPASAQGSTVSNKAILNGTFGNNCVNESIMSNEPCVFFEPAGATGYYKDYRTQGAPGCPVLYFVGATFQGTSETVTVNDQLPIFSGGSSNAGVTIPTIPSSIPSVTPYLNSGLFQSGNITVGATGALVNLWTNVHPNSQIGLNIVNTATITNVNTLVQTNVSTTFPVQQHKERLCLQKEIVDKKDCYAPNDKVKYRLRVQNLGSQSYSDITIKDLLSSNHTYVQNSLNYYTVDRGNQVQILSNGNMTAGVADANGNIPLSYVLNNIRGFCNNVYIPPLCGDTGARDSLAYFLEFEVMVTPSSGVGNIENYFSAQTNVNSSIWTSNTTFANVCRPNSYTIEKKQSIDGGITYTSGNLTISNSSNLIRYEIKMTPVLDAFLFHGTIVDLLPSTNTSNDKMILGRNTDRTSPYPILELAHDFSFYRNTTPLASSYEYTNVTNPSLQNIDLPNGFSMNNLVETSTGTAAIWLPFTSGITKNLTANFHNVSGFGMSNPKVLRFDTKIQNPNLTYGKACNTAATVALFQVNDFPINNWARANSIESNKVCLELNAPKDTCSCKDIGFDITTNPTNQCQDKVTIKSNCKVTKIELQSTGNTVQFATLPNVCTASSNNPTSVSYALGCSGPVYQFNVLSTASGSTPYTVVVTLNNGTTCVYNDKIVCPKLCMTAADVTASCGNIINNVQTYNFSGTVTNYNNSAGNLTVTPLSGGVVGINPISVPANTTNFPFTFSYTPSVDASSYCFKVELSSPTFKCSDTICFKTPNCPPQIKCCDGLKIEKLNKSCCSKLIIGQCEVKNIVITTINGTIDGIDLANCTDPTVPSGATSYTITGCSNPQSLTTCVKATGSGGVTVTYTVTFISGEKCTILDKVDCPVPPPPSGTNCCEKVEVGFSDCEEMKTIHANYTVTNIQDCLSSVIYCWSPNGAGISSNDVIVTHPDGTTVTATSINIGGNCATMTFNPALTTNDILTFVATANVGYSGSATIQTIHNCVGQKPDTCKTSLPWNPMPMLSTAKLEKKAPKFKAFYAVNFAVIPDPTKKIRYISIGISDKKAADDNNFQIIGVSGARHTADVNDKAVLDLKFARNGKYNASFELIGNEHKGKELTLFYTANNPTVKLVYHFYDKDGSEIGNGSFSVMPQEVSTASKEVKSNITSLSIAPNPASDRVNLSYSLGIDQVIQIDLLDVTGRVLSKIDTGFKWRVK